MPGSSTNPTLAADFLIELERTSTTALHQQIEASIRRAIRSGRLGLGTSLPPTRTMAADLGVSRGVVVEAYQQLVAEGYLTSRAGGYTQVAIGPEQQRASATRATAPPPDVDFGYGRADVSSFPRAAWLRSIKRVFAETPSERLTYTDGSGLPELRGALADYLNRVRGTSATAEQVVICNGYAQGIRLVLDSLVKHGARRLALEDPSSEDDARPYAEQLGLEIVGIPVGDAGVGVEALERSDADAVVLTPSHQWPTGSVLSAESRAAVLRWAAGRGAWVVEDDYDAEYRYDRTPIGAMQGLAPEQVVYAGSASKTLAPGLRLGWLVVPARLRDDVVAAKVLADRGSPALDQLTFADFLSHGEFDRHLRRMRPVYRRRRDALIAALRDRLPEFEPIGIAAGLHLISWLPDDLDEQHVTAEAAARGLRIQNLAPYRIAPDGPRGLIFGYSILSERAIGTGVALLADTVAAIRHHS